MLRHRLAKIVATVGPASAAPDNLRLLHDVGVDAFRLNFSHGSHADHARAIASIRALQKDSGNSVAIIADMQGPKLRVGTFKNGGILLGYRDTLTLTLAETSDQDGVIAINHPELFACMQPGDVLKFDDGKLQVTIKEVFKDRMTADVDVPGRLSDKKGLNVVGAVLPMSAMTEKDRKDMAFALSQDVDFIALSFVQSVQDVVDARAIIGDKAGIIVKFEKPSAIEDLDAILAAADAAMVARGDLGVELPLEQVPVIQRRIIRSARALGRPVIVATHMLESMIKSPTPTRAEASDVATAIYQGADAVMLSAETAVGHHPATAVAIMDRIMKAAEEDPSYADLYFRSQVKPTMTVNDAISQSIRGITDVLPIKAVLGFTKTGSTVKRIARQRPPCPILGLTPDPRVACRMTLTWGVRAVVMNDPENFEDMLSATNDIAKTKAKAKVGDSVIIAAGIPFGRPGMTDTLKIALID